MSVVLLESFEHASSSGWSAKYQSVVNTAGSFIAGRYGSTRALRASATSGGGSGQTGFGKHSIVAPTNNDWVMGCALRVNSNLTASKQIFQITGDGASFVRHSGLWIPVQSGSTYQLLGTRATTSLGTAAWTGTVGVWYWVEMRSKVHDTTGTIIIKVDGVEVLNLTAQDTRNAGAGTWDGMLWGNFDGGTTNHNIDFDDLYLINVDGVGDNDFIGEIRGAGILPTGAGASAQFTPNAGANWDRVDDGTTTVAEDDDTTYNEDSTVGHKDTFAMANMPGAGTIIGVNRYLRARKNDAGTRTARTVMRISGTDYEGSDLILSPTYQSQYLLETISPATGVKFTQAEIDALEFGYKVQA